MDENKKFWLIVAVVVVVVIVLGYLYLLKTGRLNYLQGFSRGYFSGQSDLQSAQGDAARQAAEEAAEEANPFEVDPYEKVKDALNPFK